MLRMSLFSIKKILAGSVLFCATGFVFSESRNALLIANEKYQNVSELHTPINEASGLAPVLKQLGFNVKLLQNASQSEMYDAVESFKKTLSKDGGIGFFHYGGHAIQVDGVNYLIPIDAVISDPNKLSRYAFEVEQLMSDMVAESNIVILDSCRDNPFKGSGMSSGSRGLSIVDAEEVVVDSTKASKSKNSIIVFSAEANTTAQDGMFTPILTKHLTDKTSFTQVLRSVRREVLEKSKGKQEPINSDKLQEEIYLNGKDTVNYPSDVPTVASVPSSKTSVGLKMIKVAEKGISMSATEVTQKVYSKVMNENPSLVKGDNKPVTNVSWYDALYFCNKLSKLEGKTPVYSVNGNTDVSTWGYVPNKGNAIKGKLAMNSDADGYRLPTIAEWGTAAKADSMYKYAGGDTLSDYAWYNGNSKNAVHDVAKKMPNAYGFYDMSGNAREWCSDPNPSNKNQRACRGGSVQDGKKRSELYDKFWDNPAGRNSVVSFRVVSK